MPHLEGLPPSQDAVLDNSRSSKTIKHLGFWEVIAWLRAGPLPEGVLGGVSRGQDAAGWDLRPHSPEAGLARLPVRGGGGRGGSGGGRDGL